MRGDSVKAIIFKPGSISGSCLGRNTRMIVSLPIAPKPRIQKGIVLHTICSNGGMAGSKIGCPGSSGIAKPLQTWPISNWSWSMPEVFTFALLGFIPA